MNNMEIIEEMVNTQMTPDKVSFQVGCVLFKILFF